MTSIWKRPALMIRDDRLFFCLHTKAENDSSSSRFRVIKKLSQEEEGVTMIDTKKIATMTCGSTVLVLIYRISIGRYVLDR